MTAPETAQPRRRVRMGRPPLDALDRRNIYVYPQFNQRDVDLIDQLRKGTTRAGFVLEATRIYCQALLKLRTNLEQVIIDAVKDEAVGR